MVGNVAAEEVPEQYAQKGVTDAFLPYMDCPAIDLSKLTSSVPEERDYELHQLHLLLTSWGCFQVINHGISASFLDELRELSRQFFGLPVEEKKKYTGAKDAFEGYGEVELKNCLHSSFFLHILSYPEHRRKLQLWPQQPESFRPFLEEFTVKLHAVAKLIFKAMANSLKLEENSFLEQYGDPGEMFASFNFYPRCPLPDSILGLKEHTDGSGMTMVLQDNQAEGLQVLKDDQWFKVPVIPDALVINVGDQMEIMSNGIFKSPMHRVVVNKDNDRVSISLFSFPESENEIGPLDQLISKDRPQLYKKVKNYYDVHLNNYKDDEPTISTMKL